MCYMIIQAYFSRLCAIHYIVYIYVYLSIHIHKLLLSSAYIIIHYMIHTLHDSFYSRIYIWHILIYIIIQK